MAKSRLHFLSEDVLSSAQAALTSRDRDLCTTPQSSSGSSLKGFDMQWVYQLTHVAEGLMSKLYRLNQILDYPDSVGHVYSEAFWKAGVFPNQPKICILLAASCPVGILGTSFAAHIGSKQYCDHLAGDKCQTLFY